MFKLIYTFFYLSDDDPQSHLFIYFFILCHDLALLLNTRPNKNVNVASEAPRLRPQKVSKKFKIPTSAEVWSNLEECKTYEASLEIVLSSILLSASSRLLY